MSERGARIWFPKEAYGRERVGACLRPPLQAWGERWFPRKTVAVGDVRVAPVPAAASSADSVAGVQAALDYLERGRRRILEAVLDIDLQSVELSDGDRKLLDRFVRRIVQDLADGLDALAKPGDEDDARQIVVSTIALDGQEILNLSLPDHALAPLMKAQMPQRRGDAAQIARRSDALKQTKVMARGVLGSASLSLDELEGVSVGDVLVLDRGLSEPVDLRMTGSQAVLMRGKLCHSAGQVSIQL